ncbi:MAG: DUF559 domain-containing protein [Terracidiphilus sp.]
MSKIPQPLSRGEEEFALHCKATGLHPVREFQFHPQRKWRVDFAFVDDKLAIEIEGGTHSMGRHNRADGYAADLEKYNALAVEGWSLLRYTPAMVTSGRALSQVADFIDASRSRRA